MFVLDTSALSAVMHRVPVVRWVDWDEAAARRFGTLKATLRKQGTPIDDFDIAIASIALTLGAVVATRNAEHFDRIESLQVEDWETLPQVP